MDERICSVLECLYTSFQPNVQLETSARANGRLVGGWFRCASFYRLGSKRVVTSRDFTSANRTRSSPASIRLQPRLGTQTIYQLAFLNCLTVSSSALFCSDMTLKRKRSAMEPDSLMDHSPQSTTSTSSASYRASTSPTPCPQYPRPMQLHIDREASPYRAWVAGAPSLAGQVGSRTRKRHRDDRPEEAIVHRMYSNSRVQLKCANGGYRNNA